MKFIEKLKLENLRLEEAKQLYQKRIVQLIPELFEEIKENVDIFNKTGTTLEYLLQNVLIEQYIPVIKIVRNYTGMDLISAKNFVLDNKDLFVKLANEYRTKLLSKEE